MGLTVIGVDPGLTGALAVIEEGVLVDVFDMPVQPKGAATRKRSARTGLMVVTQKKEVDAFLLNLWLRGVMTKVKGECHAFVEQVSPMVHRSAEGGPVREGSVSTFSLADSFGVARALLSAHLPAARVHRVRPQVWKAPLDLLGKDKDAARIAALNGYPRHTALLARKKDIGRADAIMIATYGFELLSNNGEKYESISNHAG